jgi:hypothetical protein
VIQITNQDVLEHKLVGGCFPSPKDDRDYKVKDLIGMASYLPSSYVTDINIPVFDQLTSNECVACSLATIKYIQEYTQTNNKEKFSPSYLYGNRTDDMLQEEGMYPREALKTLQDFGIVFYKDLPDFYTYEESHKLYLSKKEELDKIAYPYRISSYYKVDETNEIDIKHAIYELKAVSAMFPVYKCVYKVKSDGILTYQKESLGNLLGYHQMTIIGWTEDDMWIIQNSWGSKFGDNGRMYIPFDYPIVECWSVVDEIIENKYMK